MSVLVREKLGWETPLMLSTITFWISWLSVLPPVEATNPKFMRLGTLTPSSHPAGSNPAAEGRRPVTLWTVGVVSVTWAQ